MPVSEEVRVFPVIGLEVHAQLSTRSKLFCPCPTTFAAAPNSATCPVCLGFPGTLPVLNREAVTLAMRLAMAVGGTIDRNSTFARKNYFYPDLPKGYQITQFDRPISTGGAIAIDTPEGEKAVPLVRIHIEEDAGKSLHDNPYPDVSSEFTLVEWNRAGTPLVEIVSEPALRSAAEAAAYLTEMRKLLRALSVSEANMEEGNMRCDANVSVRPSEEAPYGTRVEVKNMNSIKNVGRAIEFEIERQCESLAAGQPVLQETRLFDAGSGRTRPMRSKEEAHDYRYFPEPDLGRIAVGDAWLAQVRESVRETPREKKKRFIEQYGLTPADAELLSSARPLADYFESVAEARPILGDSPQLASKIGPKAAARWISGEILRWIKESGRSVEQDESFEVKPQSLANLIGMVEKEMVSQSAAKMVLEEMVASGKDPAQVVSEKNLGRLSDEGALETAVGRVISGNPAQVAAYRAGKTATLGWFVGQVMKETGGRADPAAARRLLERRLAG
jgi:aspartyl-tRNA(Asn)/glutamyl-tRNA(Gln) amidotransferase subunit B